MATLNLALRFLLEVAGLVGAGYVAWQFSDRWRWAAAIGAAVALALAWALLVSPNASNGLAPLVRELLGSVLLLSVAGLLALAGRAQLAGVFAVLVVVNTVLLEWLGQPEFSD